MSYPLLGEGRVRVVVVGPTTGENTSLLCLTSVPLTTLISMTGNANRERCLLVTHPWYVLLVHSFLSNFLVTRYMEFLFQMFTYKIQKSIGNFWILMQCPHFLPFYAWIEKVETITIACKYIAYDITGAYRLHYKCIFSLLVFFFGKVLGQHFVYLIIRCNKFRFVCRIIKWTVILTLLFLS